MKITATLALALAVSTGGLAFASDARIPYGDLDMSRAAGASAFDARVEAAAERLCRDARRPGSAITDRDYCRAAVRREAMAGLPVQTRADYARASSAVEY